MYKRANYTIMKLYRKFITSGISSVDEISRKIGWTLEEKRNFIKNVLIGNYVPPIILDKTDNSYTLIDGLERCKAICDYINEIYDVDGLIFSKIDEKKKNEFLGTVLDIVIYKNLSITEKISLYKSYNKGNLVDFDLFNLSCSWDDMILTNTILSQSLFKYHLPSLEINPFDVLIKIYLLIEDNNNTLTDKEIWDFTHRENPSISKEISINKLVKSIALLNEVISIDNLFIRKVDNVENMLPILLVYIYKNIDTDNINTILINEKLNNDIDGLNVLMQNFCKADMNLQYQIIGDILN